MMLYIALSYLIMLGVIIQNHSTTRDVSSNTIVTFMFSPVTLPIFIGTILTTKN
jgi:hypothetical protein